MTLLTLDNVSLAYGHIPLLNKVNLQITSGERICLVGRNGTGKSTLFRVINSIAQPDEGELWHKDTLRISHLQQEVVAESDQTVFETVAAGLGNVGKLLTEYHNAAHHIEVTEDHALNTLSDLQHRIEVLDGWNINLKVETVLSRLSLPADKRIQECSGGIRRRVMLAQALVSDPDLLLLDEPTNHMDIASITWLEEYLLAFPGALMFITHDRTLLKHLSTRIIELDRGILTSYPGNYDHYRLKKEALLEAEEKTYSKFDKKLAEHEAWIRQGIKARRTRNEGRVRRLEAMRHERSQRIARQGKVKLDVDDNEISGKLVVDLRNISFSYGEQYIVRNFSTRIMRGDRIGIIGPNGSGKSTLLRLLLGELKPDVSKDGWVVMGTKLEIAYFDQQRTQLDTEKTVRDNISGGSDYIMFNGRPRHVISYLKDFLFPPERIDSPVKILSGGERNRLQLAQIFTRPANMLVLDEPTNDLDVETLELLEDLLSEFEGTLLLVSHDRAFLDSVVTATIVFEGDGRVAEYAGGYEDWVRQRPVTTAIRFPVKQATQKKKETRQVKSRDKKPKQKLTYKEKLELEALPASIEKMEQEQRELEVQISNKTFYKQDKTSITTTLARVEQVRTMLNNAYKRWEELAGMNN